MELSIRSLVVIIISIVVLILGIVFLIKVNDIGENLVVPLSSNKLSASVFPESSQQGTLFRINAVYSKKREQQDLSLIVQNGNYSEFVTLYDDGNHMDNNANDGLYGGFFDSSDKLIGDYEIKNNDETLASFSVFKSNCEIISGNYKSEINFVILNSGYDSYNEFKINAKEIISGRNSLLDVEPFKSNKDKFSFTIVNSSIECEEGCYNMDRVICCEDNKVYEQASQCSYDSIFVLVNSKDYCGSASSYAKVCSKNPDSNLILMHELGHSFADLADEYVYEDYDIGEIKNVNCDTEGCDKWENITNECYKGCSYNYLYRPAEKNSVMLDLYPKFNAVCQEHIKELINNYVIFENQEKPVAKSYFISLRYNRGEVEVKDVILKPIKSAPDFRESDYSIKIFGNNEIVFETGLLVPNKIYPLPASGKIIVLGDVDFAVSLPYYKEADKLVVYENETKIAEKSLVIFADKCGNKICDEGENHLNCKDCSIIDNFCETSKCDPDCESQKNCRVSNSYIIPVLMVLLSLLILIIVLIKNYKK